jgi:death-on-curing protein
MGERASGFLYEGGLNYCVESARDLYNEKELPDILVWKAAYYLWCLITNHPFLDGNKRTAFQVASVFLLANGYILTRLSPEDAISVLGGVAAGQVSLDDLTVWVRKHLRPEA